MSRQTNSCGRTHIVVRLVESRDSVDFDNLVSCKHRARLGGGLALDDLLDKVLKGLAALLRRRREEEAKASVPGREETKKTVWLVGGGERQSVGEVRRRKGTRAWTEGGVNGWDHGTTTCDAPTFV